MRRLARLPEGRRWSADLSGPGGLVICGMGGIGRSMLAGQVRRPGQPICRADSRGFSIISGEVSRR